MSNKKQKDPVEEFILDAMQKALDKEELHDDFAFILNYRNKTMNSNQMRQIFNLHNKYLPGQMHQYATYCGSCRNNVKQKIDILVNIYQKHFKED